METTENNISGLEKTIGANGSAGIQTLAHTIKGAAAQIYATLLSQITYDLEFMAKENNLEGASEKLTQLKKMFDPFFQPNQ